MGNLPGWWLGEADGRHDEPYISPERWDHELKATGFSGVGAVIYDHEPPYQINATMVIAPTADNAITRKTPKRITLLHNNNPINPLILLHLETQNLGVDLRSISQTPPPNQDIISLLDLSDPPFLSNISSEKFTCLLYWLTALRSSGVLWLTRSAQLQCQDPRYGLILGLARTIRSELSIDFATLELDALDAQSFSTIPKVLGKFQRRRRDAELDPDFEYAVLRGVIHIPRFRWISVPRELSREVVREEGVVKKLVIGKPGLLQTLQWERRPRKALKDDEVEVDIRAVGLNFKDVLIAMGIIEGPVIEGKGLGCEGAGVIRRVGPAVRHLKPGDRVIAFEGGCFSTLLTVESRLCAKIPDDLGFEDAATMPSVYGTVVHSLIDIGGLKRGQVSLPFRMELRLFRLLN
ncbi:putative secondary metabolism biosynthetic enzyme [Glutinoglossum americanum]|uniref:Secondary metabolism biosynthetic enzyme n=1 Tax=Glutinoglossum americanum TaxID=1670608 RepID=A0A9P8L2I7_9PEZI|nr:putative secondary metabolism biosynthetic enzyme [Glutinoglossum americanum]